MAQVLISIIVTLALHDQAKCERRLGHGVENKALEALLTVGRVLIMFCIYVGFLCVMNSSLKVVSRLNETRMVDDDDWNE